jgi:hypothetical protein
MENKNTVGKEGASGENQSGPGGINEPHGRSSHANPGMQPGISQAAREARRQEGSEEDEESEEGDERFEEDEQLEEDEATLEQQRKEASTERD